MNQLFSIPSLLLVLSLPFASASAQTRALSGLLSVDIRTTAVTPRPPILISDGSETPARKSPWLAGTLSVLVPGAGQVYAEAPWWRAVLYGAIEACAWTTYAVYNAKGNDATHAFEQFADSHWDVDRYVRWIAANYPHWTDEQVNKQAAADALGHIYISHDPSLPPWQRIDFVQLNLLERAVKGGFSHTLPPHGDQQYYEEVGKYAQFRSGWDDHSFDADTALYAPEFTTQRNLEYVTDREQANRYLGYAVWAVGGLVANHVVSMLDAALAARGYNLRMNADIHGQQMLDGTIRPTGSLGVSIGF